MSGVGDGWRVTVRRMAWAVGALALLAVLGAAIDRQAWESVGDFQASLADASMTIFPAPLWYLVLGGFAVDHAARRRGRWRNALAHVLGVTVAFVVTIVVGVFGPVMVAPLVLVPAASGFELFLVPVVAVATLVGCVALMAVPGSFPVRMDHQETSADGRAAS